MSTENSRLCLTCLTNMPDMPDLSLSLLPTQLPARTLLSQKCHIARCVLSHLCHMQLPRIRMLHGPCRLRIATCTVRASCTMQLAQPVQQPNPKHTILHGAGATPKFANPLQQFCICAQWAFMLPWGSELIPCGGICTVQAFARCAQITHSLRPGCAGLSLAAASVRALYNLHTIAQQKSAVILLRIWVQLWDFCCAVLCYNTCS